MAAVWSFTYIFLKAEENAAIPPIIIMAGRAFIAFICLLVVSIVTRKDLAGHFKHILLFLVFAILGITLFWLGLAFGQEHLSAGLASVMTTTVPAATYVILVYILRTERFSVIGLAGLIIGAIGIAYVVGIENILQEGSELKGVLILTGGFLLFTINGILVGKYAKGIDPVITTTYFLGLGVVTLTALSFIFEGPLQVPWTKDNFLNELALGVICTASGYFGYYYLIQRAGAYFSSFIFFLVPVFGLLSGHLIMKDKVATSQIFGVTLVLLGVYIIINREKYKKK